MENRLNASLGTAKNHARDYEPMVIENTSNIIDFCNLHNAVATTLPPGTPESTWHECITALSAQAADYQKLALQTVGEIKELQSNLRNDSSVFGQIFIDLNEVVNGDSGALAQLKKDIESINNTIDGQIATIVVSGIAIAGGGIMIGVGFCTSTLPAMLGGVGIIAGGSVALTVAGTGLHTSLEKRDDLISSKVVLTNEVKLAATLSACYNSLQNQCESAISAASQMAGAWGSMVQNLDDLSDALRDGLMTTDEVQQQFFIIANNEVNQILADSENMKRNITGVSVRRPHSTDETIGDIVADGLIPAKKLKLILPAGVQPNEATIEIVSGAMQRGQTIRRILSSRDESNFPRGN